MKLSEILGSKPAAHKGISQPWYENEYAVAEVKRRCGENFDQILRDAKKRHERRKALGEWCDRARVNNL